MSVLIFYDFIKFYGKESRSNTFEYVSENKGQRYTAEGSRNISSVMNTHHCGGKYMFNYHTGESNCQIPFKAYTFSFEGAHQRRRNKKAQVKSARYAEELA